MKIAATGASGLIGSALVEALRRDGHEVLRLVRREPKAADEARWDPDGGVDTAALAGTEAAVHLAGANVGIRRSARSYRHAIRDSRVAGTTTFSSALASLNPVPRVLISASGAGYYGNTGDDLIDESAPPGRGFFPETCVLWEAAAEPARQAGIRVVHPRPHIVLSRNGGALGRMLPIFRLGLGGRLGSGRQYWSFVSLADLVRVFQHALTAEDLSGPVNVATSNPVTNAEATKALAAALHRPAPFPVPPLALRVALGEFAGEVLGGVRLAPRALERSGFTFDHPTIRDAIRAALDEPRH
jgi:uncharacterized protein (TIGR01777 family)